MERQHDRNCVIAMARWCNREGVMGDHDGEDAMEQRCNRELGDGQIG